MLALMLVLVLPAAAESDGFYALDGLVAAREGEGKEAGDAGVGAGGGEAEDFEAPDGAVGAGAGAVEGDAEGGAGEGVFGHDRGEVGVVVLYLQKSLSFALRSLMGVG